MLVNVRSVSQDIDLASGGSSFSVVLQVADRLIRATVSQEDARVLLAAVVHKQEMPTAPVYPDSPPAEAYTPAPSVASSYTGYPEEAVIFGGQPIVELPPEQEETAAEVVVSRPAPVRPQQKIRPRHVQADAKGNPIINGIAPESFLGSGVCVDEDGVAQG